ncbi:hypothetical protein Airi01_093940 [Actinoallomurus iriomotensis]|uniref:Uncharacterized protein n=1 Tax=Actinoallomurus iriomotensis TaxID=478107 RepID=A0A9W6VW09_9ACTN|nr:hypothetical protein Airi01_093940 [Actinoallomurus iriomotensis]
MDEADRQWAEDTARLYDQGWRFARLPRSSTAAMASCARILRTPVALRNRGGTCTGTYREDRTWLSSAPEPSASLTDGVRGQRRLRDPRERRATFWPAETLVKR